MLDQIEKQIAQVLKSEFEYDVEITVRGTDNEKVHFTISGDQFSALKAAQFMSRKLATIECAMSDPEDKEIAYWYMVSN